MLSFPAQNWEKAAAVIKPSPAPRGSGWGRLASRITPRLYLSDYYTATNPEKLTTHGITHIISVVERPPTLPDMIRLERRLNIPLADSSEANILQHLDHTTAWIINALAEDETNKVLVSLLCFVRFRPHFLICGKPGTLHAGDQQERNRCLRISCRDNQYECHRIHSPRPIYSRHRMPKYWVQKAA